MSRILHLVDERAVEPALTQTLSRAGHISFGATSLPEALHTLRTQTVDLIVADERAPGLSGSELAEVLDRGGYDIPLILLADPDGDQLPTRKLGTLGFVHKPVRPEHLMRAIDEALESARIRRENESLRGEIAQLREELRSNADHEGTPATQVVARPARNGDVPPLGIVLNTLNVDEAEKELIKRALELNNNNRTRTAEMLGISVRTLRNKLNGKGPRAVEGAETEPARTPLVNDSRSHA